MRLDKYKFIKKQISKTNKKNDENYVVTRIWHRLDNIDVKMVTQQYIVRNLESKQYALADIYFPQFDLIVEIDEPYHFSEKMLIRDQIRQNDIVQALNCKVYRVTISNNIEEVNKQVDEIVAEIQNRIINEKFVAWDLYSEYNPKTFIQKGYIDADDHPVFKTVSDCCNCFGAGYKGFQGSGTGHKFNSNIDIKALKFYPNGAWNNKLDADEEHFTEFHIDPEINEAYVEKRIHELRPELALFAHVKSDLGGYEYVFKGWYQLDAEKTKRLGKVSYSRISRIMPTYYPTSGVSPNVIARALDKGREIGQFYDERIVDAFRSKYQEYQVVKAEK